MLNSKARLHREDQAHDALHSAENESTVIIPPSPIETEGLQSTGQQLAKSSRSGRPFSTRDLLIVAIVGVIGGIISGLVPFQLLIEMWYPFVGGNQLISGFQVLWYPIAYGITKNWKAVLPTALVKSSVMVFLGATWGVFEIVFSLYEAFFILVGFWLVTMVIAPKERETFLGWGIACGLGNLTQVPLFWWITGKFSMIPLLLFDMAMMLGFVSGVLMAGVLGRAIVLRLRKAGVC